jgi:Glycosyltransferases involved in cell wall biogenesis
MKLIIQIPCYNEASTLAIALADLPREIAGVDKVEWLIINDGCTDNTVEVAIANGVDHVVSFPRNRGLAKAFLAGIDASLTLGADVIVNTDADNQYCAADIQKLVDPILAGKAEIVIGARPISEIEHFSPIKKVLQKFGSWIVRITSNTNIPDAPSGFRAISRNAAMQLHVFNQYTYTLETIIQAGLKGMVTTSVPIRTNADLRPSRLVKSIYSYVRRSVFTILRIFMTYKPLRCFAIPGALCFSLGLAIGLRFMYFYISGDGSGHIQSLILGALLLGSGFFLGITGLLADLISVNRRLLEDIDYRLKKIELSKPE